MGTTAQKLQAIVDSKADIADAIEEKGGTVPATLAEYGDAIRALPSGEPDPPDVEFIDYDGTTLYTYTFAEANELTELPTLPSRSGFTNEGWNYTLQEVKTSATAGKRVVVGCTYITSDEVTRIYVTMPADDLTLHINFSQTEGKSVLFDWGDGTTDLPNSTSQMIRSHTYAAAGDYVVSFTNQKSYATLLLNWNIGGSGSAANNQKITGVAIGKISSISGSVFSECDNITAFSIPKDTTINTYCCDGMTHLQAFVLPATLTTVPAYMFRYCDRLSKVSVPATVTSVGNCAFQQCAMLYDVRLVNATSIGEYAFEYCVHLERIQMKGVSDLLQYCFHGCGVLTTIDATITGVESHALDGCCSLTSIGTSTITHIGGGTSNFAECVNLVELGTLAIPAEAANSNRPTIGQYCFRDCKSLHTLVVAPDDSSVSLYINNNAFYQTGILVYDFSACSRVPEVASINAFSNSSSDKVIRIPASDAASWKAADVWKQFPVAADVLDYDTSTSYAIGDFCKYNGLYYRCKSATSGNWNSSKWELVTGFLLPVT